MHPRSPANLSRVSGKKAKRLRRLVQNSGRGNLRRRHFDEVRLTFLSLNNCHLINYYQSSHLLCATEWVGYSNKVDVDFETQMSSGHN